jgi:hypothetical protein
LREAYSPSKGVSTIPAKSPRYTKKEERQAEHIKESEIEQGRSEEEAERIAYAMANKPMKKSQ